MKARHALMCMLGICERTSQTNLSIVFSQCDQYELEKSDQYKLERSD